MDQSRHDHGTGQPGRRAVLRVLGAAGLGAAATPLLAQSVAHAQPADSAAAATVSVDWANVARVSKSTATLQVVVNPLLQRDSAIHDATFQSLAELRADYVRFVPWLPYPRLGVAELDPPANGQTSWDFSLIDPIVEDFEKATRGHSTMLNFSTIPEWMWELNAPQAWTVSNGQLLVSGSNVSGSVIGVSQAGADWTDYSFAVDVTPLQTGLVGSTTYAQAGWVVRMDDSFSGYGFLLSNFPYTSPAAPGYLVLTSFSNGAVGGVAPIALPVTVTGGDAYHVVTTVSGTTLTVTVNGVTAYTGTDSRYASGKVGFRESNSETAMFDNVQVTAPDGTVLLSDDFSDGLAQWSPPPPPWDPPADPTVIDWAYEVGTELAVPVQTVADYYARVVSWYTAGGFTDEYGNFHHSGHHYPLPFWEVLNEVEAQAAGAGETTGLSPQFYTQLYDATVTAIRKVSPRTQFVGLALGLALSDPGQLDYVSYFLDPANHQPGVPVEWISYHIYIEPADSDTPDTWGSDTFAQADSYLAVVTQIEAIRKDLAPHVRTTVNETGTMLGPSAFNSTAPIPAPYWNWSGAMFAYLYANLAMMGIEVVGESQLTGYPGQFPSVSMLDWDTGLPNARYRVLQLLLAEMRPGDALIPLAGNTVPDAIFGLGLRRAGQRKLLLVNKTNDDQPVQLAGLRHGTAKVVDQVSAGGPVRSQHLATGAFTLPGYAVAVITLAP